MSGKISNHDEKRQETESLRKELCKTLFTSIVTEKRIVELMTSVE